MRYHHTLSPGVFDAFLRELVMLLFLIGSYTLLAWVLKAARLPIEDLRGKWP